MSINYYQGIPDKPYHLSVGAILVNKNMEIACHYFDSLQIADGTILNDFYILMRETIEVGETLEIAMHRGLKEEFGAEGGIITYAGSIRCHFENERVTIEKTTVYFLVDLKSINEAERKTDDLEAKSKITWLSADELIPKMQAQGKRLGREDVDESEILKAVQKLLK